MPPQNAHPCICNSHLFQVPNDATNYNSCLGLIKWASLIWAYIYGSGNPSQLSVTQLHRFFSSTSDITPSHLKLWQQQLLPSRRQAIEASMEENNNAGSDSDSNSVEDSQDYYEPISAVDLDNANDDEDDSYLPIGGDGLSNGHCMIPEAEEGISSISINENAESEEEKETETEPEEIRRAFEEDERRRRSPLVAENAVRVMEAMRAISFHGTAPDWASDVNEDRWIDQLRRLRSTSQ
ncbi:unnamed protein product [Arabidopsis halleri]